MSPGSAQPPVRALKGTIVSEAEGTKTVITFQYNPEKLVRTVTPSFASNAGSNAGRAEPAAFAGAPTESFDLEARFDASDALAAGNAAALKSGIRPQLALLELLAYPSLDQVEDEHTKRQAGSIGVVGMAAPSTLFVFGTDRAVPVRIKSVVVTEEFYNSNLNPIRATVKLSMEVVTYSQVKSDAPAYTAHKAYQQALKTDADTVS